MGYTDVEYNDENTYWRASVASETLTGVTQSKIGDVCLFIWRASVASETLTGVTQSKIGDVYWRASVASETLTGVKMKKSGMFIYLYTSGVLEHKWRASLKLHYC